jgi:sugar phosphate isomerase/epimerase
MHKMISLSNINLVEFHLSYKDLDEDIHHFATERFNMDFIVHCPELFANDHLLDLCSGNTSYRKQSIVLLQKVIDITRILKSRFRKSIIPLIIVNVGGFSNDEPLPHTLRKSHYQRLQESLMELDTEGVEIIPQTMPPFPWLFGGQRYHNLFLDPDEIVDFCRSTCSRICLDVAHSKLSCNYFRWSFEKFIEKVGEYIAHLHIVDASGVDGEGLQIGDGEIDFYSLSRVLKEFAPKASFIPEIWQGHKNSGEGFWVALDRLERYNF